MNFVERVTELSTEDQVVKMLKDTHQNSGASQMGECTISNGAALSLNVLPTYLKIFITTPT